MRTKQHGDTLIVTLSKGETASWCYVSAKRYEMRDLISAISAKRAVSNVSVKSYGLTTLDTWLCGS